uniref:Uncharacterized protein n=1 Tax=Picea glauca TaxID=3330 RepID=A0A101M4B1_PICGL|nr:hypothetical protein ABT39_MTgene700 [Picea glauca]
MCDRPRDRGEGKEIVDPLMWASLMCGIGADVNYNHSMALMCGWRSLVDMSCVSGACNWDDACTELNLSAPYIGNGWEGRTRD